MDSILKEIYNGGIFPSEQAAPNDLKYKKTACQISDLMDLFYKQLSAEQYKKLEDLMDLCANNSYMENYEMFSYGFNLGALLIIEVFMGNICLTDCKYGAFRVEISHQRIRVA